MKFLSKIPSLATLIGSRWFVGLAAAGLVGGGVWMYASGQLSGYQRGYERAETAYQNQISEAINTTVSRRDAQWSANMEATYADLNEQLQRNQNTIQQERLLRQRLSELQGDVAQVLDRLRSTELGTCNLSDDFDRLFLDPAEAEPAPGTASGGGS